MLAESVVELKSLEKNKIEKEIQELQSQESEKSQQKLLIAKSKLEAIESKFYDKI